MYNDARALGVRNAELFPVLSTINRYHDVKYIGTASLEDGSYYIVAAVAYDGSKERLYFSTTDHLLTRRYVQALTALGPIPFSITYGDYRTYDGVQIPYTITVSRPRETRTELIANVHSNVKEDSNSFDIPN